MSNTHHVHKEQDEMNKEKNTNTSFASEKSTSLDNNISQMKNQEFDSETDDIDDSEIEIVSYEEMDDNNNIVKNPSYLIEAISSTLSRLVKETASKHLKNKNQGAIFTCPIVPNISIYEYLKRIVKYTNVEQSTLIIALIYIDRICQNNYFINEHNIHKLLFTSILIAIKYNEDDFYKNDYYAQIAGVGVKELFRMEEEFLALIYFTLYINEKVFEQYKKGLIQQCLL